MFEEHLRSERRASTQAKRDVRYKNVWCAYFYEFRDISLTYSSLRLPNFSSGFRTSRRKGVARTSGPVRQALSPPNRRCQRRQRAERYQLIFVVLRLRIRAVTERGMEGGVGSHLGCFL